MRRKIIGLILFACMLAAPQIACGQSTCPAELAVVEQASVPNADWSVGYSGYKIALAGVTVFEGPPSEQASLVPDSDQTTKDTVVQTWRLLKSTRRYWSYWLQCQYANTTAQIYRRLPADVTRCDVTYERNVFFGGGGRVVKRAECK
jgi:hypothetical protein